jgi:uncharacterized membrane protein
VTDGSSGGRPLRTGREKAHQAEVMTKKPAPFWTLPWRYALFLLVCLTMVPFALLSDMQSGIMVGFDVAVLVFVATLSPFFGHDTAAMRDHARAGDTNRTGALVTTGIVMTVMLVVVASELRQKHEPSGLLLGLIVATLVLGWLFSNLVYTFHYAYLFYRHGEGGGDHGGLDFPERPAPDYWDFAYFAFTLGMTFQTSDVAITSPTVRRVALFHCLAAFIFNLGVIAFTINIIGG